MQLSVTVVLKGTPMPFSIIMQNFSGKEKGGNLHFCMVKINRMKTFVKKATIAHPDLMPKQIRLSYNPISTTYFKHDFLVIIIMYFYN